MNRKEPLQAATAVALAISLVACEGSATDYFGKSTRSTGTTGTTGTTGGGSQSFNLQAGIANMVAQGFRVNVALGGSVLVNGSPAAVSGSGVYTLSAGVNATFNGAAAVSQIQSLSGTALIGGRSTPVSENVTAYYTSSNSEFLGQVGANNEYDVAQAPFQYPTSIVGGSSGTLGTILRYSDSTMSMSLGTALTTYVTTGPSTQGGPISIAITTMSYDTTNALVETDVTDYSMTSSNVISFVASSTQTQTGTLTLAAQ
jgi:hypothetical protein